MMQQRRRAAEAPLTSLPSAFPAHTLYAAERPMDQRGLVLLQRSLGLELAIALPAHPAVGLASYRSVDLVGEVLLQGGLVDEVAIAVATVELAGVKGRAEVLA
jgi:hypothetical protein